MITTYDDARDADRLQVNAGNDGVSFIHLRADVGHTVNLDRPTVAALVAELTEWLQAAEPAPEDVDPHMWPAGAESILRDAHGAIYGDREDDYGSPRTNMTRTAVVWQGLLLHKLADGASIDPEDVVRCMVGVKLARDVNAPKRDNRVDGAGYFALLDRLETGR